MKKFDKCFPDSKGNSGSQLNIAKKQGWKAALEWIYLQCCPEAWDVGDIEDDIEEELKDG